MDLGTFRIFIPLFFKDTFWSIRVMPNVIKANKMITRHF